MAAKAICHCRICGKEIDRNIGREGAEWISPSRNWYYHVQCYEDFARKKNEALNNNVHTTADNDLWFSFLFDYLRKDLKMSLNMPKVMSQWQNFLKKGYTAKGIYFSMKYFYEVQHGDPTKGDGIGIVSYIYSDACQYWINREDHNAGICARIESQIQQEALRNPIKIFQFGNKKKEKNKINLASIAEMEDEQ